MNTMKNLKRKLVYEGLIFKVWQEEYEIESHTLKRDIVEFPETCAVLPIIEEDAILITQFRYPLKKEILEIPAGKIDPGETPEEAAKRELMEEIKMKPEKLIKIGAFYLTPGYSTERIHIYIGENLKNASLPEDLGENIKIQRMPLKKLMDLMNKGEIEDAKTLLALLYYFHFYWKK
uniref:NUDIX hydrolase n=1 Tax=candidate division CPR3 bacterium TaxID=2268181 RepID=A0A7V3JAT6_UNCC3